jgi:hypothetical protein
MTRCLRFASLVALTALSACSRNPYKGLATHPAQSQSVLALRPQVSRELYRCVVDGRFLLKRFHLSGILFFKRFADGSTRAVFQNELGIPFFDFRWDEQDSFSVVSIMPQLNKPAIIKTLRTDFDLLLMNGLSAGDEAVLIAGNDTLSRFPVNNGFAYYKVAGGRLRRIGYVAKSPVTTVDLESYTKPFELPGSIIFTHHKAGFGITLKKLSQDEQ